MRYFVSTLSTLMIVLGAFVVGDEWDWSSDTQVDYEGPHNGKVQACAYLSEGLAYSTSPPSATGLVDVEEIRIQPLPNDAYEVTGLTREEFLDQQWKWGWVCRIEIGADQRSLIAQVSSFEEVDP
jgi:hypothetical protein